MTLRDAAIRYAEYGWRVFPCSRSKIPLVKDWPNVATTDLVQVAKWWTREPSASIGFATGELVVIDVDGRRGLDTRRDTEAEGLEWPITLTCMTGRREGGMHLYYRAPEGQVITNAIYRPGGRGIGPGVDVRGKGGLTVLPPSRHKSGRPYQWTIRVEPAILPSWMAERLRRPEPRPVTPPRGDGTRYALAALDGESEAVARAVEGTLNDMLNRAAFRLGQLVALGAISEGQVRDALLAAAMSAGHPERGAARTIESGLTAGMRKP